jgi:cytochrome c oxidase subunit 2
MTLKVTGRQWYWDYEYPDQGRPHLQSSYMIPDKDVKTQPRRPGSACSRPTPQVVLPVDTTIQRAL